MIFAPATNCAIAGDAFSGLQSAVGNSAAFDGSQSYSSKPLPRFAATKSAPISSIKEEAPTPKPSLKEKAEELVKDNKNNIIATGLVGFAGYLFFGGPVGIAIGAAAIVAVICLVNL